MRARIFLRITVFGLVAGATVVWAGSGESISVATAPPVVVASVPVAGSVDVDPKTTTQIRVTFSKPMMDQSWSWSQISGETFPDATGKPSLDKDGRTHILPVKLEPGRTYAIWVNSQRHGNFKDKEGRSGVPYLLVFETKAAG